jgi:hypothetical protein
LTVNGYGDAANHNVLLPPTDDGGKIAAGAQMRVLLLTLVFIGATAGTGSAAPIVYSFTGTLTGSAPSAESNEALRALTAGDQFTGSFWYDFTTPPPSEGTPTSGIYVPSLASGFSLAYEFVFETLTISGGGGDVPITTAPFVQIGNAASDTFALTDLSPQSAVGDVLDEIFLSLAFTSDTWADRSLPETLPPGNFTGGSFRMSILPNPCAGACYELSGTIDTLEARVPEPSVLLLTGVGLAASFLGARSARLRKTGRR